MSERRRFNRRERTALYLAADGRCENCGRELEPGWHGDHVQPYSRGGETDVINGQALCPDCNWKKGAGVGYSDTFATRPFQRAVIESVLDGMASGRDRTIVLAAPGSGKTLAYQAAATYLRREYGIEYVAVFVPRIVLARQCETSWMYRRPDGMFGGNHALFDARGRIGAITHVPNQPPLTPPGQTGIGFVATYSALVFNPAIYESWARQHHGRFLLVADESQFCGASDEKNTGTRAGTLISMLHEYAAHTLLLTGTPYRSDGQPLVLANYDEPDGEGKRRLLCHAEAGYADGIADGYLRRFEATMHDARVRWKQVDNTAIEYDLSVNGEDLRDVLRKPEVWQSIANGVVDAVRDKQRVNRQYRGLISCMEQQDAKQVYTYLTQRFPDLHVVKATTEDGPEAERALREFQAKGADVLVTVRKAFIGYDCPEITVVGVLTHYRDKGHLMQLVGRGLRMWSGAEPRSQSCRVITTDDPRMQEFVDFMRGESEEGLRERARRESAGERLMPDVDRPLGYVEWAATTTARASSNDTELDDDQRMLIEAVKRDLGMSDDVTSLARFAEALGIKVNEGREAPEPPAEVPLTERERVDSINAQVVDVVKAYLSDRGVYPKDPGYSEAIARVTAAVNSRSCKASEARTVEQAEARLRAAWDLRERVS